jgi:hypothetical protein
MLIYCLDDGTEDERLGIPYDVGPEGKKIEYFDLKRQPELISKIPGIGNFARLKTFLYSVNGAKSLFRTLRCEPWCKCQNGPESSRIQVHWNLSFSFEVVNMNSKESFDVLRERFLIYGEDRKIGDLIHFHFKHIPTVFNDHGLLGYCEDIEVFGLGTTYYSARQNFINGIETLENFFIEQSQLHATDLQAGHATIS